MSESEPTSHTFYEQQTDNFGGELEPKHPKSIKSKIFCGILILIITSIIFVLKPKNQEVSAVFITHGDIRFVKKTIKSFEEMNTLKLSKMIILYDGPNSDDMDDLMEDYENNQKYKFIVTQSLIGEISSLDLAIGHVQTSYYFLSVGLWNFTKKGFLEKAMNWLQAHQKISQVAIKQPHGVFNLNISLLETPAAGYSVLPSLHRLDNYKMIENGYVQLTRNVSYRKSIGDLESLISFFYLEKGLNIMCLNESYIQKFQNSISLYKPYRYQSRFQFSRYWETPAYQRNNCQISLKLDKYKVRQHRLKRQTKKQVGQQIKVTPNQIDKSLIDYGIHTAIQIESPLDKLGLKKRKNYDNVTYYFTKSLYVKENRYEGEPKKQPPIQKLVIQKLKSIDQSKKYLSQLNIQKPLKSQSQFLRLGVGLKQNPKNSAIKQSQYLYYSNLYNTDQFIQELSYNIFSRTSLTKILESINNQNYSNYKIVFAADENEDSSAGHFNEYLYSYYPKLVNRYIASLTNQDRLGTAGNHYMYVKNYCKGSDIVLTVNGDSIFIGRQGFKVINAIYQDQETWMVLFNPVQEDNNNYFMNDLPKSSANMRNQAFNTDVFLVTYRYQLVQNLPLEYVIEFLYDNQTNSARPRFYQTESNVFHVYAFMELSGEKRVKFSDDPIYFYKNLSTNNVQCFWERQLFTQAKASIKYSLSPLNSITDWPKINYLTPKSTQQTERLKKTYQNYQKCLNSSKVSGLKLDTTVSELAISEHLKNALQKMKSPNFYFSDMDINLKSGLPLCFMVMGDQSKHEGIVTSIKNQDYENTRIIIPKQKAPKIDYKTLKQKALQKGQNTFQVQTQDKTYKNYKTILQQLCIQNSIIMFINKPLNNNILKNLNEIYQYQNVWMTYSVTDQYVQVQSFYLRIFSLLGSNDYQKTNQEYLESGEVGVYCLGMLQLCPKYSYRLDVSQVYSGDNNQTGYYSAFLNDKTIVTRHPYDYLLTLSQDYYIDVPSYQTKLSAFQKGKQHEYTPNKNTLLNKNSLMIAVQYQQLPYLPDNHYLNYRQIQYLNKVYQIDKYSTGQYQNKQIRFCLTVYGRNNTENSRYSNILKTLLMQNYTNYHIVFIDDDSDDSTLEDSIQYIKNVGFPKDRIKFIKNIKRRYATYNIINSAFNYCGEDDVQVRIDGDDIIIGKQVLRLFNAFYQKNPQAWVIYSNFKSSFYTFGLASEIKSDQQMLNCAGGRRRFHFIAPLTTWRVKLIRSIPLRYHQLENGAWLNTLYDDALQFAFRELATVSRIKYIPYITYGYNTGYGSNDNSDMEKIKDRISVFEYVIYKDSLQKLNDINQKYHNPEVTQVLSQDYGNMYKTIQF